MQDLIAGRIDYFCTLSGTVAWQVEGKLVKPIANLSRERSPMLPALATAQEQGLKDFDASTWFGFFVPRHTPAPVIQRLHDATVEAMDTPSVQERLKEAGAMTVAPERRSPSYMSGRTRRQRDREERGAAQGRRPLDGLKSGIEWVERSETH